MFEVGDFVVELYVGDDQCWDFVQVFGLLEYGVDYVLLFVSVLVWQCCVVVVEWVDVVFDGDFVEVCEFGFDFGVVYYDLVGVLQVGFVWSLVFCFDEVYEEFFGDCVGFDFVYCLVVKYCFEQVDFLVFCFCYVRFFELWVMYLICFVFFVD